MIIQEKMSPYVNCKVSSFCMVVCHIQLCLYSGQSDKVYAGSNSYRESFLAAMDDIKD